MPGHRTLRQRRAAGEVIPRRESNPNNPIVPWQSIGPPPEVKLPADLLAALAPGKLRTPVDVVDALGIMVRETLSRRIAPRPALAATKMMNMILETVTNKGDQKKVTNYLSQVMIVLKEAEAKRVAARQNAIEVSDAREDDEPNGGATSATE